MSGIDLIAAERRRQIDEEGWTKRHDDDHDREEIAMAAVVYACPQRYRERVWFAWPWDDEWYKPTPDNRIRELVKAGALIAAEIDRLEARKPIWQEFDEIVASAPDKSLSSLPVDGAERHDAWRDECFMSLGVPREILEGSGGTESQET